MASVIHFLRAWLRILKRFAVSFYVLNRNRMLGRSFLFHPRRHLFIETVSFCNLACKFCSYPKNLHPRTVMDDGLFRKSVDQAAAMGFRQIALTPINGDIFMDRKIIERMRYIQDSTVESISFYTNLIGADEAAIAALFSIPKLVFMEISIYGHDLDSFRNITRRGRGQYRRLIDNLATVERLCRNKPDGFEIVVGVRTYRSFAFGADRRSDLLDAIEGVRRAGIPIGLNTMVDNWGGDVTRGDIAGIDMDLTEGRFLYRKGPCGLPFDSIQITAEGKVNACACRDPRGSLTLGDLGRAPLSDIVSVGNEKWRAIVEGQEAGRFNKVCSSCGFYQSIHDDRRTMGPGDADFMTREESLSLLGAGAGNPGQNVDPGGGQG